MKIPLAVPAHVRVMTRGRDRHHCWRCGLRGSDFHHRRTRSIRDAHTHCTCNAVTLCGSGSTGCHGWVHGNPFEARRLGLIVSRHVAEPGLIPVYNVMTGWRLLDCEGQTERTEEPR